MKKLLSIFVLMLLPLFVSAQNLLHYAVSTNGERGECLFPEDESGNVFFSSVIDAPCSADSIMLIADDYISAQNVSDRCIVKNLSKSSRTSTYSIQLNIGKQMWGVEYWGSPLFVFSRDASHVKFKCIIEARNGKFKYSVYYVETGQNKEDNGSFTLIDNVLTLSIWRIELTEIITIFTGTELVGSSLTFYKVQDIYNVSITDAPINIGKEGDTIKFVDNYYVGMKNNKITPLKTGKGYAIVEDAKTKALKAYGINVTPSY